MLEIIYDANLINFKPGEAFEFFGVGVSANYNWSWEHFHYKYAMEDGTWWVEHGPSIGHVHSHTKRGYVCRGHHQTLEFIVPIIGQVPKYVNKLGKADGLVLCEHFFRTLESFCTSGSLHVETGRFRVPPDHFYFLGVLDDATS